MFFNPGHPTSTPLASTRFDPDGRERAPCSGFALCFNHCSARAAQDIKGHHRPVIASNFHSLVLYANSPFKKFTFSRARSPTQFLRPSSVPSPAQAPELPRSLKPGQKDPRLNLFIMLRSRSLSELTRQFTPPTKNGHAPPPSKSRKSSQSVYRPTVWTW